MAETVFVRTGGGSILEMDVPAEGTTARDIFDYQVAHGTLVPIKDAKWVEAEDGTRTLEVVDGSAVAIAGPTDPVLDELSPTARKHYDRAQEKLAAGIDLNKAETEVVDKVAARRAELEAEVAANAETEPPPAPPT